MSTASWARVGSALWSPPAVRTVVVCPHPDDEVLGAGGLIVHQRRRQVPVTIVAVTDGEAAYDVADRDRLAARRRAEQQQALGVLGVTVDDVVRAGIPDGGVAAHEKQLFEVLCAVVQPGDLLVAPWEHDFHADHEACGRAARRAGRRQGATVVGALVWGLVHTDPTVHPPGRLLRLPLDAAACADRRAALAAHRSQVEPVVGAAVVIPELVAGLDDSDELYVDVGAGATTSQSFFEDKYQRDHDPWDFAGSPYERDRYRALLDRVGRRRWRRIYEPGCSIGELTVLLATLGDEVVAADFAPTAVAAAKERCRACAHVTIEHAALPHDLADGPFDLIVFSELGYYFDAASLARLVGSLADRLEPGGTLLGAHWTGTSPDHVLSGAAVHTVIDADTRLRSRFAAVHPGYVVAEWERTL